MNIILFDDSQRVSLLPFTFTRPCAELRIGILSITEKWKKYFQEAIVSFITEDYLQTKYPLVVAAENCLLNGRVCPDVDLLDAIEKLQNGMALLQGETLLAIKLHAEDVYNFDPSCLSAYSSTQYEKEFIQLAHPEDVFKYNSIELSKDFARITQGRTSANISTTNTILGDNFFAEANVDAECATFNTKTGPIYLGNNTTVLEGSHIRGAFALCHDSQVKMGSKIYGATTVGPYSRVGGEINESVIFGYSNKGHEGYLGNSVIGEWCNIGADSNNSNLKNNYEEVKLWDYTAKRFRKTGLQFCGLIMGDHSKCGINTMFNTGTVVGVSANIFGSGFPRNFVPDFAWGGAQGFEVYSLEKVYKTTEKVFERRNRILNQEEKDILKKVFELTEEHRRF